MTPTTISETECRWYAPEKAYAKPDGEVARATFNGAFWEIEVFHRGMVSSNGRPTLDEATNCIAAELAKLDEHEAWLARMTGEEVRREAERRVTIADIDDRELRALQKELDEAKSDAERRKISHPSYYTSHTASQDQQRIARISIAIENRKAVLAAAREAA